MSVASSTSLVSVEEYLRSTAKPNAEYINGVVRLKLEDGKDIELPHGAIGRDRSRHLGIALEREIASQFPRLVLRTGRRLTSGWLGRNESSQNIYRERIPVWVAAV